MECKHCGIEMTNPKIFFEHEANCLDHQKQNGLIQDDNAEQAADQPVDYAAMTMDMLRVICKDNNLEGYTTLNKEDLINFIKENVK